MSKRNRSWRRSQNKRIEKKAFIKFYSTSWYADSDSVDERRKQALNSAKYLKNNMKNCSCWMCGNPRYPKLKHLSKNNDVLEIKENFRDTNNKKR